jgi:hypothetical protein
MADPFEAEAREVLEKLGHYPFPRKVALVAQALRRERNRTVKLALDCIADAATEHTSTKAIDALFKALAATRKLKVPDGE